MKPLSLILNTHNPNLDYLEFAIQSVKDQTLDPSFFELIVFDDASSAKDFREIKKMANSLNNSFVYGSNSNLGLPVSRNAGIDLSQGRYIALLDDDDALKPHALESALQFFYNRPEVKYSYSKHDRIDELGAIICERPSQEFSFDNIFHYNFVGHLKSFEKEAHYNIGGFDPNVVYAQDWEHVLRFASNFGEHQIKYNDDNLYYYRTREGSISSSKNEERKSYICEFLTNHLLNNGTRLNERVYWSHRTEDGYNYFDWEEEK